MATIIRGNGTENLFHKNVNETSYLDNFKKKFEVTIVFAVVCF